MIKIQAGINEDGQLVGAIVHPKVLAQLAALKLSPEQERRSEISIRTADELIAIYGQPWTAEQEQNAARLMHYRLLNDHVFPIRVEGVTGERPAD